MMFGICMTGFLQFLKTAILVVRIYYWNKFISRAINSRRRKNSVRKKQRFLCRQFWEILKFVGIIIRKILAKHHNNGITNLEKPETRWTEAPWKGRWYYDYIWSPECILHRRTFDSRSYCLVERQALVFTQSKNSVPKLL